MPAIFWWESKTIWSCAVAALCWVANLFGHNIDPGDQAKLIADLMNVASGIGGIASVAAIYFRTQTVSAIRPQVLPTASASK